MSRTAFQRLLRVFLECTFQSVTPSSQKLGGYKILALKSCGSIIRSFISSPIRYPHLPARAPAHNFQKQGAEFKMHIKIILNVKHWDTLAFS